jgi:hypothetical protein
MPWSRIGGFHPRGNNYSSAPKATGPTPNAMARRTARLVRAKKPMFS